MVTRKIFAITSIIFLLFLISCQSRSDRLNTELLRASRASMDSFKFNENCLHICWLGINPSITTAEEAKHILKESSQIDNQWYQVSDSGFITEGIQENLRTFHLLLVFSFRMAW